MERIISIFVIVLCPLLPAFILFKFLPTEAKVEGPWQGLKIKLGGAFGGYFLLVLLVLGYFYSAGQDRIDDAVSSAKNELAKAQASFERQWKVYTITGKWKVAGGQNLSQEQINSLQLVLHPEASRINNDQSFTAKVTVGLKQDNITPDFPTLEINCAENPDRLQSCRGEPVDLNSEDLITLDKERKEIKLRSPIVVHQVARTYGQVPSQNPTEVGQ